MDAREPGGVVGCASINGQSRHENLAIGLQRDGLGLRLIEVEVAYPSVAEFLVNSSGLVEACQTDDALETALYIDDDPSQEDDFPIVLDRAGHECVGVLAEVNPRPACLSEGRIDGAVGKKARGGKVTETG